MRQVCEQCGKVVLSSAVVNGVRLNTHRRKACLDCRPHKPHRRTAPPTPRPIRTKTCEACGKPFPAKLVIDGKVRSLYRRRFCFDCSAFGIHNTSRTPPGALSRDELREYRRKRRNSRTYRYQKRRRRQMKLRIIELMGGKCRDCGYAEHPVALDPHHADPTLKEFTLGAFDGSMARLRAEVDKCVLLCANCHRLRHAFEDLKSKGGPVVEFRRRLKARAVAHMGSSCAGCGRSGHQAMFDFHHVDAAAKEFGISTEGIPRPWARIVAELAKCVMLCANCHREVHAGVRRIDTAIAEDAPTYVAAWRRSGRTVES